MIPKKTLNPATLRYAAMFIGAFLLILSACNDDNGVTTGPDPTPSPTCDTTRLPVVFVHGFLGSGDTYAGQAQRFSSNGYCPERLFAFDWNSLGEREAALLELDAFIDEVLSNTGASQVDLAGHSAGGSLSYEYLGDAGRAAKVAHYAHLASGRQNGAAGHNGNIPTINIYSTDDLVVESGDIPGAQNKAYAGLDHYQAATAPETFEAMFVFFNDGERPEELNIVRQDAPAISGKVLTFGENQPVEDALVTVYRVDPATGRRADVAPSATFITDAEGSWGPLVADPEAYYEFFVEPDGAENRPVHYYREPFRHSNPLTYLRTLPPPGSIAGILVSDIPEDDRQTVIAIFSSSRAVLADRDELRADALELSTEQYAPRESTNIAFFLYDDGDQASSGDVHSIFQLLTSFVTGIDYFISTDEIRSVPVTFNGRTLQVPNLKSASDGIGVVVFD